MMKKISYQIVNKSGEILDDIEFEDYDTLADHMLEMADKYYQGVYTIDDTINISALDDAGNVLYKDTASFGSKVEDEEIADELTRGRTESVADHSVTE